MCEGKPGTVRLGKDIAARVRSEHCACHRPSIIISRAAFIENSIKLMLEGIHLPPTPLVCCEDLGDNLQGQALPQVGGQCEWGRQLSCAVSAVLLNQVLLGSRSCPILWLLQTCLYF